MTLGCCGGEDRLDVIQNSGFDYIEPGVPTLRADLSDMEFAPIKERFQCASVKAEVFNIFVPTDLKITGDSVDTGALMRHVETVTRRASELGGEIIVFGSGGARNIPSGFSRTRAYEQLGFFCAMAADIASRHDITIVIEPLTATKSNLITSVAEGAQLVEQVAHPNLALLADLYHMEVDLEPWANILENALMLKHIHVPVPTMEILTTEGQKFNHECFLTALKQTGYDGRISIEDNGKRFENFAEEVGPAANRIRELWKEA
ncbi:MAG: sugar phosphate isomerase/epimerase family protein [Candidatus Latescibacteria bacterium]|jgi:sugar phosphate isomerase/epimerase|nr:sugar phosphate isomerase/epimerase family protein [Candidatus Latescibacterota bacterium]